MRAGVPSARRSGARAASRSDPSRAATAIRSTKKLKRLAIKSVFSDKVAGSNLIVVDSIALEGFKTKTVVEMLKALGADKKALILMPELDQKLVKSAANIPGVKTALVNTINVYDLVNCDKFIVCKDAVAKLEEVYA